MVGAIVVLLYQIPKLPKVMLMYTKIPEADFYPKASGQGQMTVKMATIQFNGWLSNHGVMAKLAWVAFPRWGLQLT